MSRTPSSIPECGHFCDNFVYAQCCSCAWPDYLKHVRQTPEHEWYSDSQIRSWLRFCPVCEHRDSLPYFPAEA